MIKYDFPAINAHRESLRQLITEMEHNLTEMNSITNKLLGIASGKGRDAFQQVAASYSDKLANYRGAMMKLEIAIGDAGDAMSAADQTNANNILNSIQV